MHKKVVLFATIVSAMILAGGVINLYGQESQLKTLLGHIRWKKAMGVQPKAPGSREPADNICAGFFVVVIAPGSEKPYQYDIALEPKLVVSMPDFYSCAFEMKVPNNVGLAVHAGMGDGLAWPKTQKTQFYYAQPWIDAGRPVRGSGQRVFTPAVRNIRLGNKDMQITFELVEENGASGQSPVAPAKDSFVAASRPVFSPPFGPTGSAVLTWDAGPEHPNAELWVSYNGSRERTLFIKQPKGAQQVQVQRGLAYTYVLMDGRNVLATTTVVGQ